MKYDSTTTEQQIRCNEAIDVFTQWLNSHHEANDEPTRVTRDSFFEYDDPPHLLLDSGEADTYYRVLIFSVNPYHDEGGPNELTCYFDSTDLSGYNSANPVGEVGLRHIDQLFDTNIQPIYEDGKLVNEGHKEDETVLRKEEA